MSIARIKEHMLDCARGRAPVEASFDTFAALTTLYRMSTTQKYQARYIYWYSIGYKASEIARVEVLPTAYIADQLYTGFTVLSTLVGMTDAQLLRRLPQNKRAQITSFLEYHSRAFELHDIGDIFHEYKSSSSAASVCIPSTDTSTYIQATSNYTTI